MEVIIFGNPKFMSEHVLGVRGGLSGPAQRAAFHRCIDIFQSLRPSANLEPGPEFFQPTPLPARFVIPMVFGNLMYGTTEGGRSLREFEIDGSLDVEPGLRVSGNASAYQAVEPGHHVGGGVSRLEPAASGAVAIARGTFARLSWDASAYFVSALPIQGVASYTRIDTQLTWKFAERAEFSLVGQNLLHNHHLESMDELTLVNSSLIKRSAYAKFTWRFW